MRSFVIALYKGLLDKCNNIQIIPIGKKRMMSFVLINFHPSGELEASICGVIKGSQ